MTKQQLFKLLKRRIEVSRFEAHVRRDLLKRLGKLHNQVKNRVYDVDLDNIGKRELNRLIKEIEQLSSERHAELTVLMTAYSAELIDDEADFIRREMDWQAQHHKALGAGQAPDKTPDFVPLVLGATISEWLSKQARDYTHGVKMAVRTGGTLDHLPRWLGNQTKSFTVTWANATSQQTQRKLAEKSKGFSEYQHNSLLDSKTSDVCIVRHLKRWTADKEPIDHDLQYEEPPLHRHCRSFMTFEFDFYDSSEIDGVTADEWLDSMSEKEQNRTLGVGKAAMYRRGDITLRDLLDQSGRPQTLQALKRKHDPHFIEPKVDTKALKGARFQSSQLRDKLQKHAKHLGIETTKNNPKTQKLFQEKIIEFMNDENVRQKGTYKNKNNKAWYNSKTKVVVVFDKNSSFLTALQLADDLQYRKYIEEDFLW